MTEKQPDPSNLLKKLDIKLSLVGFYDAPDPEPFKPLIIPEKNMCIFDYYNNWMKGETLFINKDHYGCGGAGRHMCGIENRDRESFLKFLVDTEGLKASRDLMGKWIDSRPTYKQKHPNLFIGPLKEDQWEYLRSVTFHVNPDQLSALMIGAQYHSSPDDPPPVIAPFGSGCMLLFPFERDDIAQASLGTTDIAMRDNLPPDILALTVTKLMFKRLCELDEKSFIYKPFWKNLRKARGFTD
jgi:hypothetical protein